MKRTSPTRRVLPADVYDALEFAAEVYGGIGGDVFAESASSWIWGRIAPVEDMPCCIFGMQSFLDNTPPANLLSDIAVAAPVGSAFLAAGIAAEDNNVAVRQINRRRGVEPHSARVPFADWCAEMGVERGS